MCGRFTLRASASVIAEQFDLFDVPPLEPSYNIAPTQPVAAVRRSPEAPQDGRELVQLRWGLIPNWAKDPGIGNRLINARCETAAEKPAFRAALRRRRCLVVADGFYEWKRNGRKQPYFIRMKDDRPFAFAGLWEYWEGEDGSYIESCVLLTTRPNGLMAPIHNRMPVILARETYDQWLDPDQQDPQALAPLWEPYPSEQMLAYPVSTVVNNPANNDPSCIERLGQL